MLNWQAFLSAENFQQAWKKVRANNGCAGVDGETITAFERHADHHLATLRHQLQIGTYQPMPLRSLSIPKKAKPKLGVPPKTEWRGLAVPTVRDRIVQQALLNLLHPILEPQFETSSFAYRPGRSYKNAVRQVNHWRQQGYDWVLDFGYTLLFNNVLSLILAEGLNPYLGNLHRSDRKEMHLAFDLMEEWRSPIVDSLVMTLVNKKILRPTDFTFPNVEGGIYLNDTARKVFLKYFEERISEEINHPALQQPVSYRRAIQLQIQQYKRCLQNSIPYEPFIRPV